MTKVVVTNLEGPGNITVKLMEKTEGGAYVENGTTTELEPDESYEAEVGPDTKLVIQEAVGEAAG